MGSMCSSTAKADLLAKCCVAACGLGSIVMLIVSFDKSHPDVLPNYEPVLKDDSTPWGEPFSLYTGSDTCEFVPALYFRPFRFKIKLPEWKDEEIGPFSCPWPSINL